MLQVRAAERADIDTISSVLATSWKTAYRGIVNDNYLDLLENSHWVDFLTTGMNNGNIFAMVLEESQQIIGAAILRQEEEPDVANLISFYLLPDKIGQGFGHAFYNAIETELKNKGFSKCALDVLENNNRAIRFYEKQDFTDTGKPVKATLGDCEYPCKVYEKHLS